jgi:hypothetical protein
MIIYPDQPWYDGQSFSHTTAAGTEITGVYEESKNTWTFYSADEFDAITTSSVYTEDLKPSQESIDNVARIFNANLEPSSEVNLTTQQDVNWYLFNQIQDIQNQLNS